MKVFKILGIIVGIIILAGVVLYISTPAEVHVERSVVISANPDEVYAELNSFENFNAWSPWFEKDPETQYAYEGPHEGVGAKMSWISDHPEVGNGAMWIVASETDKVVNNRMEFGGYPGEPYANFYIEGVAEGTKVTWTYDEELSGFFRVIGAFMDMDEMLGPDYERGLKKLKQHIESSQMEEEQLEEVPNEMEADTVATEAV